MFATTTTYTYKFYRFSWLSFPFFVVAPTVRAFPLAFCFFFYCWVLFLPKSLLNNYCFNHTFSRKDTNTHTVHVTKGEKKTFAAWIQRLCLKLIPMLCEHYSFRFFVVVWKLHHKNQQKWNPKYSMFQFPLFFLYKKKHNAKTKHNVSFGWLGNSHSTISQSIIKIKVKINKKQLINFHGKTETYTNRVLLYFHSSVFTFAPYLHPLLFIFYSFVEKGLPTQHQSIYNSQSPNNNTENTEKYILFAYPKGKKRFSVEKKQHKKLLDFEAKQKGKKKHTRENMYKKHEFLWKEKGTKENQFLLYVSYILSYVQAQPKRAYTRKLTMYSKVSA